MKFALQTNPFCQRFAYLACILLVSTVVVFELFSSSGVEDGLKKQNQFEIIFLKNSIPFGDIVHSIAKYIHDKTPFLEHIPYATPQTDSRLSTWYLPPHQVAQQWIVYGVVFSVTLAAGFPRARFVTSRIDAKHAWPVLIITGATFFAVLYYKFRAWIQLGEWFALVYLLQPCHVLVGGYTVLLSHLIMTKRVSTFANTLMNILFDLQWCTLVAIALPDTEALLERDFGGELFLFWFEHILLVALPYICSAKFFANSSHPTWKSKLHRAWYSACIFGIHHMHVMTPVSLVGGIQVNYQTHLPKYAVDWFGKWYKTVILIIAFIGICGFGIIVDPAWKWIVRPPRQKW